MLAVKEGSIVPAVKSNALFSVQCTGTVLSIVSTVQYSNGEMAKSGGKGGNRPGYNNSCYVIEVSADK